MGETPGEDDATLVRRIAENEDERALAELMGRHAPKVTGDLRHRFRHQLQHPDVDEAVNRAALKVWKTAGSFDGEKPFGPWFLRIAHRKALDILRGENKKPAGALEFDPPDPAPNPGDEPDLSPRAARYMDRLERMIDDELKGFEQVVARADVAAGGPGGADVGWLMEQHNKKKSVVHATRSKVWKKIRAAILEREVLPDHTEVNP